MSKPSGPILVTGGAGYIGSHTHHALIERGHDVIVYDNLSTGFRDAVHPQARFVEGELADDQKLTDLARSTPLAGVIHFAASIRVEESVAQPLDYYWNNTSGLMSVLRGLRAAGSRAPFVFSSTAAVYGQPDSSPVAELAPTFPINPYGRSKLFSESVLREHCAVERIPHMILRYFNVAGARRDRRLGQRTANATHLIKLACEVALGKRRELAVFGTDYPTKDGTGVRDYIHVEDLAQAHVVALEHLWNGGASDTLNCGYGHGSSVLEVIRTFEKILGRTLPHRLEGRRAGDPAELIADSTRLRSTLGWKPEVADLETICRTALEWEKSISG
jgi:UDP-glucose 4-epimerase